MKTNREIVLSYLQEMAHTNTEDYEGITTQELSEILKISRANLSSLLNRLAEDGLVEKSAGRPVLYRLCRQKRAEESSCFCKMIGAEQSLRNAVQLAKAVILYPDHSLHTLIVGPGGAGKSYFVSLMFEFARERQVISARASLTKINCRYYAEKEEALDTELVRCESEFLFVDHITALSGSARSRLLQYMEKAADTKGRIIICAVNGESVSSLPEHLTSHFPVKIEIPSLSGRSMEERLALIRFFIGEEAHKMNREIKIHSELLYCLLLYQCDGNVKQLHDDIRVGCANAYVRELASSQKDIHIYIYDFHAYVRNGFLQWKNYRDEVERLIPAGCSFSFTGENVVKWRNPVKSEAGIRDSIYDVIEKKAASLRSQGMAEEDINTMIGADMERDIKTLNHSADREVMSRETLAKLVDGRIMQMAEGFLDTAGNVLGRVYPTSTYYGLCLHIASSLQRVNKLQHLSNEKIMETVERYKDEYALSLNLVQDIERVFRVRLPMDEIAIITMFIANEEVEDRGKRHPVVLIAMHGNAGASSVSDVVNALTMTHNTYAFNLPLEMKTEEAYGLFSDYVRRIHQGRGIIMLYDMGSLKTMAEMVMQETGIPFRFIEVPLSLIALDCARKVENYDNVDEAYEDVRESCRAAFSFVKESYQRLNKNKIIITLCMTGQGGALQMKNYLEQNAPLTGIDVVALAVSDREILLREVNKLMKEHEILCVIGTYDPKLYGIAYISIAQLFETPVDKLEMLLALTDLEPIYDVDYDTIYEYIKEQLPDLDIPKLRRLLPKVLSAIKKTVGELTEAQELGLFMHIACSVSRLERQEQIPSMANQEQTIMKHKRLYNQLQEIMSSLEMAFHIHYDTAEYASLIRIIKCI